MGFKSSKGSRCCVGAAALFLVAACGGGGSAPPAIDSPDEEMDAGGTKRDAGSDAGRVEAGTQTDGATSADGASGTSEAGTSNGPEVMVVSPAAAEDSSSADVIVTSSVTVRCQAKTRPMGERVNPDTVRVSIYESGKLMPAVTQRASSTTTSDVFEARNIDLSMVPHGKIRIECEASDTATNVGKTTVSIDTLYDKGPSITFLSPTANFVPAVATKTGEDLRVQFRIEPKKLDDGDTSADVDIDSIKAMVGGKLVPQVDRSLTEMNVYSFKLDFNDTTFFPTIPDTLSVRLEAANKRAPSPRSVTATLAVGVDQKGPTITVKTPARVGGQAPVVSGKVDVTLEIKDALAGVEPGSVEIAIQRKDQGLDKVKATEPTPGSGIYVAFFDTGSYPDLSSLNITITAIDKVGISTQTSLAVDVDTVPPWLTMDAPNVREMFPVNSGFDCSGPFDPLADAVTEGVVHGKSFLPRVIIWDRALVIDDTQRVWRYAGIDNLSTNLYIQHNNDIPLLVDTDSDPNHYCDNVFLKPTDMTKEPATVKLTGIPPTGTAPAAIKCPVGPVAELDFSSDPAVSGCGSIVSSCTPMTISEDSSMTRVIKHTASGSIPVVYAYDPSLAGPNATGRDYQAPRPGWACLVAVAKDNVGNFAFSPPMRVCTETPGYTCTATPPASLTCTDGCVIPAQMLANAPDAMPRVLRYAR